MSEKVMKEVMVSDEDHVWIDGRQLISLKQTGAEELASTLEKLSEVAEENKSLKMLLKSSLFVGGYICLAFQMQKRL